MQEIVGDRLPKFTTTEVEMIKGSFDYVGINQYTAYYMKNILPPNDGTVGYQQDWMTGFECKINKSSQNFQSILYIITLIYINLNFKCMQILKMEYQSVHK